MVYGYVYKIENLVNGKIYVGQTISRLSKRKKDHLKHLRDGTHHSKHLQHSFNKYGESNFVFQILNYATSKEALNKLEIDYIAKYQCTDRNHGYNILVGGRGVRHTPEMKEYKSILLTKNNPMKNPEVAKRQGETVKREGIAKGKNNPRYRHDVPDVSYLHFLYSDLYLTTGDICKLYKTGKSTVIRRLERYGTPIKSKSIQNTKNFHLNSRFLIWNVEDLVRIIKKPKFKKGTYWNKKSKKFYTVLYKDKKKYPVGYFIDPLSGNIIREFIKDELKLASKHRKWYGNFTLMVW
jgi:group I intron endonuclease